MVRDHVLPSAMPGILTGVILALSRAIGETAPLLLDGRGRTPILKDAQGTVEPLHGAARWRFTSYAKMPESEPFQTVAAGGILLLLGLL